MDDSKYNDWASPYGSVTAAVAVGSVPTRTEVLTYEVKNGKRGYLLGFRNAVAAGGEDQISFSVLLNGVPLENFDRIKLQVAAPENQQGQLVIKREIPQGAVLSVVVDNEDTANPYAATAKLEIGYESF